MNPIFTGSFVALVTPFRNGKVDEAKLRELVEMHASSGTDGLVPCGTTGESPTLSHDEHKRVVEVVVEAAHKRVKVLAGTGSPDTAIVMRQGSDSEMTSVMAREDTLIIANAPGVLRTAGGPAARRAIVGDPCRSRNPPNG